MGKAGKGGVLNKNFFIGPVFPVGVGDFNAKDNNVVQYFKAGNQCVGGVSCMNNAIKGLLTRKI